MSRDGCQGAEVCGAVDTVMETVGSASGCRDIVIRKAVTCRGQRGEVYVPGVSFAGTRLAEGNSPGVWIEGRVYLLGHWGVCVW